MNSNRLCIAALAALALSGCASYGNTEGLYDPDAFGEANRQSYAAMIANPEPDYAEDAAASGEKASNAVERYRKDTVKEPKTESATDGPQGS